MKLAIANDFIFSSAALAMGHVATPRNIES
jgi:hypothetical protein